MKSSLRSDEIQGVALGEIKSVLLITLRSRISSRKRFHPPKVDFTRRRRIWLRDLSVKDITLIIGDFFVDKITRRWMGRGFILPQIFLSEFWIDILWFSWYNYYCSGISLERAVVHGLSNESKFDLELRALKYGLPGSSIFEWKETLRNRVAKHMVQSVPKYEIPYLMSL